MAGSMIEIDSAGGRLPAYLSLPPERSGPGVIVIQEWWGLVPHIRNVADRLATHGFVAVAPDLYHGAETTEPDEAARLVMELRLDQTAQELTATVDALLARPETTGGRVGVMGFCMGGGLALKLATLTPEVAAVVSYYGFPRQGLEWDLSQIKGAVLYHQAEHDDDFAPDGLVSRMRAELDRAGVPATFHRYPGTTHAFFNDDRPSTYDAEAAALSWQRTLEFLRERLGGRS
jgi:carboxymethylenebutenolidase